MNRTCTNAHRWVVFPDGLVLPEISGGAVVEPDPGPAPEAAADGTPPEAPPAAPEATGEPVPIADQYAAAEASARARLASSATPEELLPDGAPYRDAAALRGEIADARERWQPFEQALDGVPDDARSALLGALPNMREDIGDIASVMGQMHPDDRRYVIETFQIAAQDPAQAAQRFADIAAVLRGDEPGQAPAAAAAPAAAPPADDGGEEYDALGFARDDPERPLTRSEIENLLNERDTKAAEDRRQQELLAAFHNEARAAGYDPTSQDPEARRRMQELVNEINFSPDGDASVSKAVERIQTREQALRQAAIDEYVNGKVADATRPGPGSEGAPPSTERRLASLDEADAAGRERLIRLGYASRS